MKLTSKVLLSAFTALTFVAVPACDDKKEDKKGDKADAKGDAKDKKEEKKEEDKKEEAKADEGGEEAKADGEEPAEGDGGDDGGDGGGEGVGVPECDDYVEKYTKGIDEKMPEAARETSKKALQTSVDAWKKAAATPAGKEGLAQACKTAADAVKATCGW